MLERARQDRDDASERAPAEADVAATGVRVIAAPAWGAAAKPLGWIVRDADHHELSANEHAACPGHVAGVEQDWVNVTDNRSGLKRCWSATLGRVIDEFAKAYLHDDLRWVRQSLLARPMPPVPPVTTTVLSSISSSPESDE